MRRLCLELGPDKIVEIGKGAATAHIGIGIGIVITASTANGAGDELSLRRNPGDDQGFRLCGIEVDIVPLSDGRLKTCVPKGWR